ncbi:uncharacterized protein LOC142639803 [Castanea sativa]|uniref:uncharacterized protein LOC142639803 n=1 Tax=Castanea sativa TaxID=21020 RepID=UPI003F64A8E9
MVSSSKKGMMESRYAVWASRKQKWHEEDAGVFPGQTSSFIIVLPQGNGQAEATNKTLIKIISKMSQEYTRGWTMHLPNALWAYSNSSKSAIGFSPFSLVYGIEVMNPVEAMTPSLRVIQMKEKEKEKEVFAAERYQDLEGLDEKREEAQECSHRYRRRMTEAYDRMTKERVFAEG